MKKKFLVTLLQHEEGVSVSCPELPGCHSQGATIKDALENIRDVIQDYLELYGEPRVRCEVREMEVATRSNPVDTYTMAAIVRNNLWAEMTSAKCPGI